MFILLCKFSYGQFPSKETEIDTVPVVQTETSLPWFKFGAQIGYGYRLEPVSDPVFPEMGNYNSKLKHSLNYGADLSYYFSKYMGMGIKYNGIYAQSTLSKINPDSPDGDGSIVPSSEKIGIHYIGVFYAARYFVVPNKHCLFATVGTGYVRYRNKTKFTAFPISISGSEIFTENTAALFAEIGYNFFVTKSLAVGLQVSTSIGLLKDRANVGHVGITLGLRFLK